MSHERCVNSAGTGIGAPFKRGLPSWPYAAPGAIDWIDCTLGRCGIRLVRAFPIHQQRNAIHSVRQRRRQECHIRKGWADRRQHGRRFFVWQILFTLASLAGFAILIGVPLALAWTFGWLGNPSEHVLPLVLGGIALFFLLIALAALLAVVHVMTKDFVVPQMALENISALEGWRRLWPWLKAEKGGYSGYVGMKIVLAIAAGIAFAIIAMVALLVLLIPLGGFGAVAVLGGKAVGLTWNFYTIALAVLVGCIALAILMFAISLLSVPVIVFFPAYSVYFFAARYVPLAALLWPPPPASFQPPLPFTPPALT